MRCPGRLLFLLCLRACLPPPLAPPPSPAADDAGADALVLTIRDGIGGAHPAESMPRRPRLTLPIEGSAQDATTFPVLFRAGFDPALAEDARRSPWSAATLPRVVGVDATLAPHAITLVPRAALEPGGDYVLVLPSWARPSVDGRAAEPLAFPLRVAEREAGAAWVEAFPPHGSTNVPSDLRAIDLGFDDAIVGLDAIELREADGALVPTSVAPIECAATGLAGSVCVRLSPLRALAPLVRHRVLLPPSLRDRYGDPIGGAPIELTSAPGEVADVEPLPLPCAIDERAIAIGCLLERDVGVAWRARLSGLARVRVELGAETRIALTRAGDVAIASGALAPATTLALRIVVEDLRGRERIVALDVTTTAPLPHVVIDEARADPIGPEPEQEYVELWNAGASSVELGGFRLSDAADRAGDPLPGPFALPPDGRVLIVADGFDPRSPTDAQPPEGTPLLRIGASIASGGLANGGEPLFLRDAAGHRIAELPALASTGPGSCVVRALEPASGALVAPSCTPGIR